jgi:hypothetical protein
MAAQPALRRVAGQAQAICPWAEYFAGISELRPLKQIRLAAISGVEAGRLDIHGILVHRAKGPAPTSIPIYLPVMATVLVVTHFMPDLSAAPSEGQVITGRVVR